MVKSRTAYYNKSINNIMKLHAGWRLQALIFITAFAILVSRRPDALFNAQFWAEDGKCWYAEAYNLGIIQSLFLPKGGYFQTISRLSAAFVQFFPLVWAPLIFNVTAIVIQVLPINLIASVRFSQLIPNLQTRLFLGLLYLALPNSFETHANITNAHWHLAILACMVVLATPSRLLAWQVFDIAVILLSGLSGPFSVLLAPIAAIIWWLRRKRWSFILLLGLSAGAVVQGIAILLTGNSSRFHTPLGATPELFAKILASQVFLAALIGQKGSKLISSISFGYSIIAILIAAAGSAAFLYCLLKAPLELRLFSIFAAGVLGMSLLSPVVSETVPQWWLLWRPGTGVRYWFIPEAIRLSQKLKLENSIKNLNLYHTTIEDYTAPEKYDIIISNDVLEHIEDDQAVIKKFSDILKPDGLIGISVPALQWLFGYHDEMLAHYRRYHRKELIKKLSVYFNISKCRYFGASLIPIALFYSCWLRKPYPVGELENQSVTTKILEDVLRFESKVCFPLGISLIALATAKKLSLK